MLRFLKMQASYRIKKAESPHMKDVSGFGFFYVQRVAKFSAKVRTI